MTQGYVSDLARPSGNITGVYFQQIELTAKRLQILKDAFPRMRSVTVFWGAWSADQWEAAQDAAPRLGLELVGVQFPEGWLEPVAAGAAQRQHRQSRQQLPVGQPGLREPHRTKNLAGFQIRPVAYYQKQVTGDANYGGPTVFRGQTFPGPEQYAVGGSVIHRFGKASVQFMVTQDVFARNTIQGTKVWLNASYKLF